MEVGSYAHRPILHDAEDIPSIEQSKLSPTELPFTADDFDLQLEQALELMPEVLGNPEVEIRYAINGLLSLTPDGYPILGETPEVKGLWSSRRRLGQGGSRRRPARRRVDDRRQPGVRRPPVATSRASTPSSGRDAHVKARTSEAFNKTYGIVHPGGAVGEQPQRATGSPMHASERELGAVFFETAGWERPFWYESNAALLGDYGDAVMPREAEWDVPLVVADHQRRASRHARAGRHRRPVSVRDLRHRRSAARWTRCNASRSRRWTSRRVGSSTRPVLDERGGIRVRPDDHATGRRPLPGGHRRGDRQHRPQVVRRPDAGRRHGAVVDQTSAYTTIGLWGPQARDILGALTDSDISHDGVPVRHLPHHRDRLAVGAGVADLVRRRARLGALRAHGAGRPAVGPGSRGGAADGPGAGRHRGLRHDRTASRRATARTAPSSTRSARSSRPA